MSRAGGGEMLFYVRRHTCADGAFEWYVLNGRRRASISFPTRAAAAAEREKLQAKLDLAKPTRKSSELWQKKPSCDGAGLRQVSNGGGLSSAAPSTAIQGFGSRLGLVK